MEEKIKARIQQVEKELKEKQTEQDKRSAALEEGTAEEDLIENYDYYDGYINGLCKELNDLRTLL